MEPNHSRDRHDDGNLVAPRRLDWVAIALVLIVSRAVLLLVGHVAAVQAGKPLGLDILCRFDCSWYLSVAEQGYSTTQSSNPPGATNYGFFPLFPLLVRIAAPLFGGSALHAALAVNAIALFAGLCYVFRYALLIGASRNAALLATALLCILPQSISFSAPYSESVFLFLFAAATYYLLRDKFLLAGVAAALLSASRPTGVLFLVFVLAYLLRSGGWRKLFAPWREPERYLPLLLAPLGLFLYLGYCFLTTGDAFAHASTEVHGWGYHFVAPWRGLWILIRLGGVALYAALASLIVLAFSLLLWSRRRYEEFALCLSFLLLAWSSTTVGSVFRYWLVLFPVWVELMRRMDGKPVLVAMSFAVTAMLNGAMMWAWTLQDLLAI